MAKQPNPNPKPCSSVKCSHVSGGHCSVMMCANYKGDCPVHGDA